MKQKSDHHFIKNSIESSAIKTLEYRNNKRKHYEFQVGQMVFKKSQKNDKILDLYDGPFEIVNKKIELKFVKE